MSEKKQTIILIICCVIFSFGLGVSITECRARRAANKIDSTVNNRLESGLERVESVTDSVIDINNRLDDAIQLNNESRDELNRVRESAEEMLGAASEAERNIETSQGAANSLDELFRELESDQSELEELLKRATF